MLSDVTTPQDLDDRFREALGALGVPARRRDLDEPLTEGAPLTGAQALALFDAQVTSRLLDLAGRWLRSFGEGFYTIGSAGHEGNAAVAAALRPTDPALLHYRSGAFYCLRAAQAAGTVPAGHVADGPGTGPGDAGSPAGGGSAADATDAGPDAASAGRDRLSASDQSGGAEADGADRTEPDAATSGRDGLLGGSAEPDTEGAGRAGTDPGRSAAEAVEPPSGTVAPDHDQNTGTPDRTAEAPARDAGAPDRDAGAVQARALPLGVGVAVDATGEAVLAAPAVAEDAYAEAARDVLRGMVASAREPIAGGRHKVFGRADLAVIPTTSTIASHLPRAVGMGLALERLRRVGGGRRAGSAPSTGEATGSPWPPDAIVVCSFGDASVNHASATAAFNTAGWYDHTGLRIPVLFVCEDNGLGISVRSPKGWVAATLRAKPGIRYFAADGADPVEAYRVAGEAAAWVRRHRRPAVLHLTTVRLMGHAGADAETAYRSPAEIAADAERDPLLATARLLAEGGFATGEELLTRYDERGWQVRRIAEEVLDEPKLASPAEVVAALAPRRPVRISHAVADAAARAAGPNAAARAEAFGGKPPELAGPLTLAQSINAALADGMLDHPGMAVFGEDVAAKGGVYGVTKGLRDRFGAARVFDTLLDETSILGLGLGAGIAGMLPVPEIQYLAYLHNAEDQLRGEAATMQFFSGGAFRNPMVVRVAGLAYQEGFGGHFHNDNSVAVLRDVPGLVIAVPARPDDAAPMLRTCLAAAAVDGSVCVFLEPIALYHTRNLYADGDGEWLGEYAEPGAWAAGHVPVGRARVYGVGSAEDVTIITFGNGVRMSLRAAATLADEGIGTRVVDLRWLAPLPVADIIREASATGRVLVVDETRRSGGVGEGVIAALVDAGYVGAARRVAGVDSFVPLGPAARQVLVSEEAITEGARTLLAR
ncbi:transketolase C-terminal domain-containing protein [Micromonospora sp. 4G57]|uniref:Transketolase C-terminal domain-containing protein n=1 Tax=Micromonospora sicca TaxID=2202420 RepID=A0ABU5JIK4_9ACTN|nr:MULTISPECIES: transketolase C-terminal domain-containing protein [unclassified Micromonospora]MDZ5445848.1 transketolase C-terminal domain-containing protein [Micromonospora sp. 4G57]MDZ5492459.1 transketolase C-terminal domain-containing protein [Micromonospora sp. 4G53]